MNAQAKVQADASVEEVVDESVINRIGKLTRMLRDSMRELGLAKEVEKAAQAIPDARDRLNYVAHMTEEAAERSLNAIDRAQPLTDQLGADAKALGERWQEWFEHPVELDAARDLVRVTRNYLASVPETTDKVNAELMEITMAQGFQDLTGQVIKKMMEVIKGVESQLLQVLVEHAPEGTNRADIEQRMHDSLKAEQEGSQTMLNGPQTNPKAPEVVTGQDQVDSLLAELGF